MNWADYVLLGILGLSVIISLWRGLIKEVLGLAVWIAAFWLAFRYSDQAQALFEGSIPVPSARMAVGFALVFIVALIAGGMLSYLLGKLIKSTGLSGTDRFFGMFFGLARAVVLIIAMVMAAGFTPLPKDPWWQQSVLLPHFESLASWTSQYLPENVRQYFLPSDQAPSEQDEAVDQKPSSSTDLGAIERLLDNTLEPPAQQQEQDQQDQRQESDESAIDGSNPQGALEAP